MTDDELRVKIAEACPERFCPAEIDGQFCLVDPLGEFVDPLNDLNAMNEAEKTLTKEQQEEYLEALYLHMTGDETYYHWSDNGGLTTFATARQRVEAFIATIR